MVVGRPGRGWEFHLPPMRQWPRLWWHNYRMLVGLVFVDLLDKQINSLRNDPPMEETSGNEARVPSKTAPPTTA